MNTMTEAQTPMRNRADVRKVSKPGPATANLKSPQPQMGWIGNVGTTPEAQTDKNGKEYCRFRLAASVAVAPREYSTQWYDVVAFGGLVAKIEDYIAKGDRVCVVGREAPIDPERVDSEGKPYRTIFADGIGRDIRFLAE